MDFSMHEYWSGWLFPSPGELPNAGVEPGSPALQANSLPSEPLDCIMTAVIAVCSKKKNLIKIGEFLCSHFRTEGGRKKQYFWHIMLYYFKKGKNATETQKDLCGVWRGCCDWLNVSQVVLEVSCWKFLSGWYCSPIGQLRLIEIKSRHWEQTTLYHKGGSQHTQNIQTKWWKSFAPTWLCSSL